jgi:5-methylcytosine-specific restriction enzyme subunit McrC
VSPIPQVSAQAPTSVELTEWDTQCPANNAALSGLSLGNAQTREYAKTLRDRVYVRESWNGLEVESNSYVGRIDLGPIRIAIGPKLAAMPLTRLLRYTYGLRDVERIVKTQSPTSYHGFQDMLISLLAAEVGDLVHRGLTRKYRSQKQMLTSPRGEILVSELIRQGGIREQRLPCRYFERQTDWHLNRILRAGVRFASRLAEDRDLRHELHYLEARFGDVQPVPRLTTHDLEQATRALTRLTETSAAALTLIRLLLDAQGLAFTAANESTPTPGFLFDMNKFFQRLVSRFLHANLSSLRIEDEHSIRQLLVFSTEGNPRNRIAPVLRPDYALFDGAKLRGFLDAKYRDIWSKGLPPTWLYQLAMYALASPRQVSVLLYATMSNEARDECIEVRQPLRSSSVPPASVILRPVSLTRLATLVGPLKAGELGTERRKLAHALVALQSQQIGIRVERRLDRR